MEHARGALWFGVLATGALAVLLARLTLARVPFPPLETLEQLTGRVAWVDPGFRPGRSGYAYLDFGVDGVDARFRFNDGDRVGDDTDTWARVRQRLRPGTALTLRARRRPPATYDDLSDLSVYTDHRLRGGGGLSTFDESAPPPVFEILELDIAGTRVLDYATLERAVRRESLLLPVLWFLLACLAALMFWRFRRESRAGRASSRPEDIR